MKLKTLKIFKYLFFKHFVERNLNNVMQLNSLIWGESIFRQVKQCKLAMGDYFKLL